MFHLHMEKHSHQIVLYNYEVFKWIRLIIVSMAKYEVSGGGSQNTSQCELCGKDTSDITEVVVEGANLSVCPECKQHDDSTQRSADEKSRDGGTRDTTPELPSDTNSLWDGDTEHWEKHGTGYTDDQLPYLIDGYGNKVIEARRDAGMTREELADEIDIPVETLDIVEQETAYTNNVSGAVIARLESYFDIVLSEHD